MKSVQNKPNALPCNRKINHATERDEQKQIMLNSWFTINMTAIYSIVGYFVIRCVKDLNTINLVEIGLIYLGIILLALIDCMIYFRKR